MMMMIITTTTTAMMMMMVIEGLSPELGHWRTFACLPAAAACLLANPELFKVYTCRNFLKKVQLPQQSHSLSVSDAFGLYTTAALYTYIHTHKQTDVNAYPYICGEYKTV